MPELPDVAVHEQYVDATSLHRRIDDVTLSRDLVEDVSAQTLRERLRGGRLESTRRHGKHLFVRVDDQGWLRLHFGMTGRLEAYEDGDPPEHTALRVDFADGGHLAYVNQRRLGEISWVEDVEAFVADRDLGPDPLVDDIDRGRLAELLDGRRGSVKSALMNQQVIAGLGNVYTDEILFQAGIHPESPVGSLGDDELDALHRQLFHVVDTAIRRHADVDALPDTWLLPNREEGVACPRCDGTIRRSKVSGRTTFRCSAHQAAAG